MTWLGATSAAVLIGVMLIDAFESVMLPRRVRHAYRLSNLFYRTTWLMWQAMAERFPAGRMRYGFLSIFGPLSLLGLLAVWAAGLIFGFALLQWSLGSNLSGPPGTEEGRLGTYLYFSGTTFFTLGFGDVVTTNALGRALSVTEAGIGFGFLAVVVSYLPVLYQAFSRREITISLLDARAGSPPSAGELLRRLAESDSLASVGPFLIEWEHWAAELLESHLSFPALLFYRSQHDNQSWVATLTAILDTSAFLIASEDAANSYQARLTFAMARHAAVDLVLVSQTPPRPPAADRLPLAACSELHEALCRAGNSLRKEPAAGKALAELRGLYEPFVNALATFYQYPLPPFVPAKRPVDNWQTSPGMERARGLSDLQASSARDEHAD